MKKILLSLYFFVYTLGAYEITQAQELYLTYNTKIKPYFKSSKLQFFTSHDGLQIAYKYFQVKNAKATIVISSGRTESMVKYPEMIYDLTGNGYSVYILDHRGQGFSSRMVKDSQLGYVKDFFNYVKDLKQFVDTIVKYDTKLFLLSHSMGAEIASLYIEKYKHDFDGAVLSSPMHQIKYTVGFVCKLIEYRVQKTPRYLFGETSYDNADLGFKDNVYTHSKLRLAIANEAYALNPKTKIGGPSVNWVAQACEINPIVLENAHRIKIPLLILQAGDDEIVSLEPQEQFCKNVGALCTLMKIDDAKHELFIEKDLYRNKALGAIFEFLSQNL